MRLDIFDSYLESETYDPVCLSVGRSDGWSLVGQLVGLSVIISSVTLPCSEVTLLQILQREKSDET